MNDVMSTMPAQARSNGRVMWARFLEYLPRGNMLDDHAWRRRHRMLEWVLALHLPGLIGLGFLLGHSMATVAEAVATPLVCLVAGQLVHHRRWASFFVTGGLVFCSMALVLLSRGSIEAHFHFFIIIGFIALYQDWVPFLWNVAFTVLSHGIGTIWLGGQIFNHPAAQQHPWLWSFIHGIAVLLACVGMVIFWRVTEDEQEAKEALGRQLIIADTEIGRRQFTSDMLINLARRNQSMLYRQLDIINQLEDKERDPDALAELFKLDHLATRVRRNAESLLVLAGEQAPRTWSAPVVLRDVVRAAIAETEDLDRVVFAVDDRVAVSGTSVADLTHLLAELTENAVRFSPPETVVTIRARPNRRDEGGQLLTVEDWGVGMPADDLSDANDLLAHPREVDLAVSQRLGFHVVARLAARHRITVSLSSTPGSGITAVVVLPAALFTDEPADPVDAQLDAPVRPRGAAAVVPQRDTPDVRQLDATRYDEDEWPVPTAPAAGRAGTPVPRDREPEWVDAFAATGASSDRYVPTGPDEGWSTGSWAPVLPAPFVDAGPVVPNGIWHGWWSPEAQAAAGNLGIGTSANGGGANGGGANGSGANGSGANGSGANGGGAHGRPENGNGANGVGQHPGRPGIAAPSDPPAGTEGRPGVDAPGTLDAPAGPGGPSLGGLPAIPAARRRPSPSSRGTERGSPARPGPGVPLARDGAVPPDVLGRPDPLVPRGPVAALPSPCPDDSVLPAQMRGLPSGPGRGLRRRVPQSHLAPELRHAANGLADTAAPLAADAAASALSRYQASRRAAQSVVDHPDGHRPDDQGEPT